MLIANSLRKSNYAEYVLYMWQVEDLIRSTGADIDRLDDYIARLSPEAAQRAEIRQWYANLCTMMQQEGKIKAGHLQINEVAVQHLEDLHQRLLSDISYHYYRQMYERVLPIIVELRAKGARRDETELHTCFDLLYGLLLLRLQHRPISEATTEAAQAVSTLLGQLADYYAKDKVGELKIND